jgi:glutamine amidotransferase
MITLVDYGLGNISAFINVYKRLNVKVSVARTSAELESASKIILPGVGAFDHAMDRLADSGMQPALEELVTLRKTPLLGICVGMQMLGESSEEGQRPGLGWLPGRVRSFRSRSGFALPMPHMGWNDVNPIASSAILRQLDAARFYFLHSFYFDTADPADVAAVTDYGGDFSCVVNRDNIFGVQFHPEKSHQFGIRLLQNFADL